MVLYHLSRGDIASPLNRVYSPILVNLQGEKHMYFAYKTQIVPAGYVMNKLGLGGSVWVPWVGFLGVPGAVAHRAYPFGTTERGRSKIGEGNL